MRRSTTLLNFLLACLITLSLFFCAYQLPILQAQSSVVITALEADGTDISAAPGDIVTRTYQITNNTVPNRNFAISTNVSVTPSGSASANPLSSPVTVSGGGGTATFQVSYVFNSTAPSGTQLGTVTITATSSDTSNGSASASLIVKLTTTGTAPTSTPTQTLTPSPTTTVTPTPTPEPVCQNGREANDPGDDISTANLIRVNEPEIHGLCGDDNKPLNDEDWFYFGAGAGKVYTIDVTQMANGLDLVIELFDEHGNYMAGNDDYYRHDTTANTSDLRPRIQSWRAPYDGKFYFVVRDKVNSGGGDRTYTILVQGESFGPTPTQIAELCNDLYEQDGLPETATLIHPNELQPQHVLCPVGDADWVKFFGAAGKNYYIYTDTRPYQSTLNRDTEAGADTILTLFDRDGIGIISVSDDIPNSLDSEIQFVPPVDGFYFVQVKNRGDLGNQFIRYDLALKLCVQGDTTCGRQPTPAAGSVPAQTPFVIPTPTPPFTVVTPTPEGGVATPTTQTSPTTTPAFLAFSRVWNRADQPINAGKISRTWLWGPKALLRTTERYAEAPGTERMVEYYDKARMEITNPKASQSSAWFVTNGLLVSELVQGRIQTGDESFLNRKPAQIPVAGDQDDASAPTYASLASVVGKKSHDRTGQYVAETLAKSGAVGDYTGPRLDAAKLAYYVPETGYSIPQAFWAYMNSNSTIYERGSYRTGALMDWVFTMGYPLSDPYWVTVKVGGQSRQVLMQPFQRRVLTYDPSNPANWQVEMGNVGRHYYLWRYARELPKN